jgi:hypothetical protein
MLDLKWQERIVDHMQQLQGSAKASTAAAKQPSKKPQLQQQVAECASGRLVMR